jgi:hypothetical protein
MRALLFIIGIYLGILLMAIVTYADVGWARKEKTIKVMIIDTGVSKKVFDQLKVPVYCKFPQDCEDHVGHGTAVTSAVVFGDLDINWQPIDKVCGRVEINICSYFIGTQGSDQQYLSCLRRAVNDPMDVINFSSTSPQFDPVEHRYLLQLAKLGTKFVTAVGNDGQDLLENPMFPAVLSLRFDLKNTVIPVMAHTRSGQRFALSNFGIPAVSELGSGVRVYSKKGIDSYDGTSLSAALHTNKLLRQACEER